MQLLDERQMTQYQLFVKSGVPKFTIGNVVNCSYESVKLRINLRNVSGYRYKYN